MVERVALRGGLSLFSLQNKNPSSCSPICQRGLISNSSNPWGEPVPFLAGGFRGVKWDYPSTTTFITLPV